MLATLRRVTPGAVKVAVARMLCRPEVGRVVAYLTRDEIPSRGLRVSTATGSVSPRTKAEIFWGLYESAEVRFVRRYVRPDLDVVDLGASLGVAAAHAVRRLRPDVRYVAVEANPALREVLARNVSSHRNSVVVSGAVDATPGAGGTVALSLGETTIGSRVDFGVRGERVARMTLSELLARENIGDYQLLCDIEGSEASLLLHNPEAFRSCRLMIIELHDSRVGDCGYGVVQLRDLAVSLGFDVIAHHGPVYVLARPVAARRADPSVARLTAEGPVG